MEQLFIDRFVIPQEAEAEFMDRMAINRNFIKDIPGFIKDEAYRRTDEQGNLVCITIAAWASEDALENARTLVQAECQRQGFNPPAMMERLGIRMERALYHRLGDVK